MNNLVNGIDLSALPRPFLESRPDLLELYDFSWRKAAENIRECKGQPYMDCAWDSSRNYQWVWDTCFMTLYARYGNGEYPGISSLDNFYRFQREDGFIAMTYDLNNGMPVYGERINPPLFAWCEWEYYLTTGDCSRFATVLPKLELLMNWIDANRRGAVRCMRYNPVELTSPVPLDKVKTDAHFDSYQFYYFLDCGSSGMDDSPRTPRDPEAGKFYDWIDLSSQMALSFCCLAEMYQVLDNSERQAYWNKRAGELATAINRELWSDRSRFYHDRMPNVNFVSCKTAAGFWPILAKVADAEKLEALVEHLRDENSFNRPIPVPSLAADDINYCEHGTYWIGGVWAPTNYMITRGLQLAGKGDVAHEIALKYLNGLARTFKEVEPHTLWECYSAEKALPGLNANARRPAKPDFVGWSGIGPIAMLIENVLGIEVNAPAKQITWQIRLQESHGIENLKVGDATVNLFCDFSRQNAGVPEIKVASDKPDISVEAIFAGQKTVAVEVVELTE